MGQVKVPFFPVITITECLSTNVNQRVHHPRQTWYLFAHSGEGAYSSVYKVERLADHQPYALKKVKLGNLSEKELENAINEVRILASITNPHIISYKEAFVESKSLWYLVSNSA
jgi:NIMA (never in mitosis gene a)-related kinase